MVDENKVYGCMQSGLAGFDETSLDLKESAAKGFSDGDFASMDNGLVVLVWYWFEIYRLYINAS